MREIKFRAWDKLNKRWADIDLDEWDKSVGPSAVIVYSPVGGFELQSDDHFEWVMYTGLKDKNGKEIYEGDIVFELTGYSDEDRAYLVEYEHNGFWLKGRENEFGFGDTGDMEVIGNIYENKELLND